MLATWSCCATGRSTRSASHSPSSSSSATGCSRPPTPRTCCSPPRVQVLTQVEVPVPMTLLGNADETSTVMLFTTPLASDSYMLDLVLTW